MPSAVGYLITVALFVERTYHSTAEDRDRIRGRKKIIYREKER
jgi:hypothetical protein